MCEDTLAGLCLSEIWMAGEPLLGGIYVDIETDGEMQLKTVIGQDVDGELLEQYVEYAEGHHTRYHEQLSVYNFGSQYNYIPSFDHFKDEYETKPWLRFQHAHEEKKGRGKRR